jgi:CPA2 family monovalent cation:H+ antiporter-2
LTPKLTTEATNTYVEERKLEHATADILDSIIKLLVLSVGAVAAFRLFKLPPILGYLLVGAITGEYALNLIAHNGYIELMGEVGVVFLLFAIGLEFSIKQLIDMKTTVLGLGGLQVIITTLAIAGLLYHLDLSWQGAVIAGGAAAMSSTAIVIKQLTEQNEMRTRHGRMALGILLFQDIAVVPFLVMIPLLSGDTQTEQNPEFWLDFAKGAGTFLLMLVIGHFSLRRIFHLVAKSNSMELFNITVLLIALTAAWVTESVGLSLALGAFLAGMMLSETEYKHQIEAEIRPFRDILMGIFFITVGTRLNIAVLPDIWFDVLRLVIVLVVGKTLIIAALTRFFAADNAVSMRTGLVLAQGGEFGFALLTLALSDGLLNAEESQAILTAIVISMVIAPFLIKFSDKLSQLFFRDTSIKERYQKAHRFSITVKEVEDHVILCGYGRIGQNLGRFLREQGIQYLALDVDAKIIKKAWEAGDKIYYGDATHAEILVAAGLYRARLVVVATGESEVAKIITETVRKKHADIPILVRTPDDKHMESLLSLGASTVIPETLEATMTVAQRVLEALDVPSEEVSQVIDRVRMDGYSSLKNYFHGEKNNVRLGDHDSHELHTIILREEDYAADKKINDLYLARFSATIVSLRRGRFQGDNPAATTMLKRGDALVIKAPVDKHLEIEQYLRNYKRGGNSLGLTVM